MPTIEEIFEQVKNIPGSARFIKSKEYKELPGVLTEGEVVEMLVPGFYDSGNGYLLGTQKRLIFIDKGWVNLRMEEFKYENIGSVKFKKGLALAKLTVATSSGAAEISNVPNDIVQNAIDYIQGRINQVAATSAPSPAAAPVPAETDLISQLEKLASLKERGILTEEEFVAQKTKLLAS